MKLSDWINETMNVRELHTPMTELKGVEDIKSLVAFMNGKENAYKEILKALKKGEIDSL